MMPAFAVKRRIAMDKREDALVAWVEATPLNGVEMHDPEIGITCAGALYNNVREVLPEASTPKFSVTWPLPPKKLCDFALSVNKLYVVEETCTYFANHVKVLDIEVSVPPQGPLPRGGEVLPAHIKAAFGIGEPPHPAPAQGLPAPPCVRRSPQDVCPRHRRHWLLYARYRRALQGCRFRHRYGSIALNGTRHGAGSFW
ncbi:hypothetical protein [Atopobium sp. oral taxon 416]|uniref:hypothetical protein n=1 Tax=Atopobium sp. oral taxon 416 TaxID=712157 RepID=UPI001BAA798E|nr:hypothetical protein [Atopobium sp. oral taxon 416]QUC04506.1 hypothetical protein J4859_06165 [Atopobium sp. oral taxon 416]